MSRCWSFNRFISFIIIIISTTCETGKTVLRVFCFTLFIMGCLTDLATSRIAHLDPTACFISSVVIPINFKIDVIIALNFTLMQVRNTYKAHFKWNYALLHSYKHISLIDSFRTISNVTIDTSSCRLLIGKTRTDSYSGPSGNVVSFRCCLLQHFPKFAAKWMWRRFVALA